MKKILPQILPLFLFIFLNLQIFSQSGWIQKNSGTTATLLGVSFADVNTGYVCGINGLILNTINGGTNWSMQVTNTTKFLRSI